MCLSERHSYPRQRWSPYHRGSDVEHDKPSRFPPHSRPKSPLLRDAWIEPHPLQALPSLRTTPTPAPDYSATFGIPPRTFATFFGGPMGGRGPVPPEPSRSPSPPSPQSFDEVEYTTDKHTGIRIPHFRRTRSPPEHVIGHPGKAYLAPVTLLHTKVKDVVTHEESIRTFQCPTGVVLRDEKGVSITYLQTPGSVYAAEYDAILERVEFAGRQALAEYLGALEASAASKGAIPRPPPHDPKIFERELPDPDKVILERVLRCKFTGQRGHSDEAGCHYCYNGGLPNWYEEMRTSDPDMM